MRIREATPADVDGIAAVGRQTWPATYDFAGPEYIAHGLATWWSDAATARSLSDTTVLVAVDEAGRVSAMGNIDLRPAAPIIGKLYVLPAAQGAGAGSALMSALAGRAPGRPVPLEYVDGNARAARFYRARGFTEIRREPGERPGWPETVWMERPPDA